MVIDPKQAGVDHRITGAGPNKDLEGTEFPASEKNERVTSQDEVVAA